MQHCRTLLLLSRLASATLLNSSITNSICLLRTTSSPPWLYYCIATFRLLYHIHIHWSPRVVTIFQEEQCTASSPVPAWPHLDLVPVAGIGMAKLNVNNDASCIITHAYQPCLLHCSRCHCWPFQRCDVVLTLIMKGVMLCMLLAYDLQTCTIACPP